MELPQKKIACRETGLGFYAWASIIALLLLSAGLKYQAITEQSPTFDEPFYLFQGVHFLQTGILYTKDVHPPMLPWFVAKISPWLGDFEDASRFARSPSVFAGPYQYRLDLFSQRTGDEAIQRARFFFQFFWLLAIASSAFVAYRIGMAREGMILLIAFLALEPTFTGVSSVMGTDMMVLGLLCLGTALSVVPGFWSALGAITVFSIAWATKFTPILWLLPLGVAFLFGLFSSKPLVYWAMGVIGGFVITHMVGGSENSPSLVWNPSHRLTFLDGVFFPDTPWNYFIQATLCKMSLAFMGLAAVALFPFFKTSDARKKWKTKIVFFLFIGTLIGSSYLLPGLGIRLVLPVMVFALFALCYCIRDLRFLAAISLLLCFEAIQNQHQALSYQNPLAGTEPRLLDSNSDWGQGLKMLGQWYEKNHDAPLVLSLFGGNIPEIYGIKEYRTLPSFPEMLGEPLKGESFSGYVAVSKNFLKGYVVQNPAIRQLEAFEPLLCFQNALCLFDVRNKGAP